MKTNQLPREKRLRLAVIAALFISGTFGVAAQVFHSGSDGSLGDLVVTNDLVIQLPPNGVLNYKTVTIQSGTHVSFLPNPANTPVFLLSQGDVSISGNISLDGSQGNGSDGGLGGPGGFVGGHPGFGSNPPGPGAGPGGGGGGVNDTSIAAAAGSGGYLYQSGWGGSTNHGPSYGTQVLIPLVGGSGGGGTIGTDGSPGNGGGGGGGAILIASDTLITLGQGNNISAQGGSRNGGANGGSGGAIRVVAPKLVGTLLALVYGESQVASSGRVRVDTADASQFGTDIRPAYAGSRGSFLAAGLPYGTNAAVLNIVQAAGTLIEPGTLNPVSILLTSGSSANQTVTVLARNFGTKVPINVVITPGSGIPQIFPAIIDNTTSNPATAVVNVTLPVNVPVTINAWTR